jgi:hypothetical protein
MVSHTINFFLQDVQIPSALGIVRPAQPPTRAPLGVAPPPRAIQGPQVASRGQPAERPVLQRHRSRHSSHAEHRSSSGDVTPPRGGRTRARATSRPRSRTPLARRRAPSVSGPQGPPGSWQPNNAAADPYQERMQQPLTTIPLLHFPRWCGGISSVCSSAGSSTGGTLLLSGPALHGSPRPYFAGTPSTGAQAICGTPCTGKAATQGCSRSCPSSPVPAEATSWPEIARFA